MNNMVSNIIYKILSMLMLYPDVNLKNFCKDLLFVVNNEKNLLENVRSDVIFFINYLINEDLLFLQQSYVDVFDRQKMYSLYLFEHIHGDSKDRGQAMVDLQNMYLSYGYKIKIYELPDYLPVFLEYLYLIPDKESLYLLGEVINIITVIGTRLKKIDNLYYKLFFVLEELSNVKSDANIVKLGLSYKESVNLQDEFEKEWTESMFHYNKRINNNY